MVKIVCLAGKGIWMETHRTIDSAEATDQEASLFGGAETIGKKRFAPCEIRRVDAFDWLDKAEPNSIHAVVTDPPYGLLEYTSASRGSPGATPTEIAFFEISSPTNVI